MLDTQHLDMRRLWCWQDDLQIKPLESGHALIFIRSRASLNLTRCSIKLQIVPLIITFGALLTICQYTTSKVSKVNI